MSAHSRPTPAEDDDFEALYRLAPCGLLSCTAAGVIIEVNDTLIEWTGFSRKQLLGTQFSRLLSVGSQRFYETQQLPVLRLSGAVREIALTLRRANGGELSVLVNSVLVGDSNGQPRVIRTAVFDATRRQQYERELLAARRRAESSESRVRVLQEASSTFGVSVTEEDLADALAESARGAFAAASAVVMLTDSQGELTMAGGLHPIAAVLPVDAAAPEYRAMATSRVVTITADAALSEADLRVAVGLREARFASMSVVPLIDKSGPVGVLICFFGRTRQFDMDFVSLQEGLARLAAQMLMRSRLQAELAHLALHDQLTGLGNRKLLQEQVADAIVAAAETQTGLALIFLDLDGFKQINDQLGHAAGDAALRQVADRLRAGVRQSDDVGRFGGDEFVAICTDADEPAAEAIAQRILDAVRQPLTGIPDSLRVTASIGIALFIPGPSGLNLASVLSSQPTSDELLSLADDAMYLAKSTGKDRVSFRRW